MRSIGIVRAAALVAVIGLVQGLGAQAPQTPAAAPVSPAAPGVIMGPSGPSPYDVVSAWHQPFAASGFAFGGNSGVFAESPRIFALDRTGGRVNVYRTIPDPARVEVEASWPGLALPLDLIVNDDAVWMTDLEPLRFIELDFAGQRL